MNTTSKLASIIALSTALSFTAATPSYALFGGGFSSAGIIAAVNKVKDSVLGGFNTLNLTNIMGFGQMTQNSQAEIAAEARMREAEQNLDLMRRIDEQKIRAREISANTRMDCVIETRTRYIQGDVQSDTIVSQDTLDTLAKMAAFDLGQPVGNSGTPKTSETPEEKAAQTMAVFEGMLADPEGPNIDEVVLAANTILKDPSSITEANRDRYRKACKAFSQVSNGSTRDSLSWHSEAESSDSATEKQDIYSDKMRSSIAQTIFEQSCSRNDPETFRGASESLHGHYEKVAEEHSGLQGLLEGGISLNEARKIRGYEWILTVKDLDNKSQELNMKNLILAIATGNVQNYELQQSIDQTNMLLGGILMSVNEQSTLIKKILED